MRGSDPDASLYWLARMLEAGEDPTYGMWIAVVEATPTNRCLTCMELWRSHTAAHPVRK